MPSEQGSGGGTHDPDLGGTTQGGGDGGGDSESESDWQDEQSSDDSECGDTGGLPGGVGGMGQDGECVESGGAASSSDSESGGGSQSSGGAVQGTGGAGEVGEFPEESAEERAERLGQELDQSIGVFDDVLAEEQREISTVGRNTEGFGDGVEGDGGISLGEQGSMASGPIQVANNQMSAPGSPIDDMTDDEIRSRTPEDIPIMVDDDIIARQLREAALAEDDPVLRDRLWAEYRKYRGL
jgi:hypothetical protein